MMNLDTLAESLMRDIITKKLGDSTFQVFKNLFTTGTDFESIKRFLDEDFVGEDAGND